MLYDHNIFSLSLWFINVSPLLRSIFHPQIVRERVAYSQILWFNEGELIYLTKKKMNLKAVA